MSVQGNNPVVSEHELAELRSLIESRSGILFDDSRLRFFSTRVVEHMLLHRMTNGVELLRSLGASNVAYDAMLERLLTQETSFLRYPEIFAALKERMLPELQARKFWRNPRQLRIWSAGCSTGEEPYSIAMALCEAIEFRDAWEIEVLATDISKAALGVAQKGLYTGRSLGNLTPEQLENFFTREGAAYSVKPKLRQMVRFAPMNLAQSVYMGRFDLIFCMNVLIYFSAERRARVIETLYDQLEPGGYLMLGHAESLSGAQVKFQQIVHKDARLLQKPLPVEAAAGGER